MTRNTVSKQQFRIFVNSFTYLHTFMDCLHYWYHVTVRVVLIRDNTITVN